MMSAVPVIRNSRPHGNTAVLLWTGGENIRFFAAAGWLMFRKTSAVRAEQQEAMQTVSGQFSSGHRNDRNSPSESPRHFAGRRDESVIVGYYTSAEVPFPRRKQPGLPLRELSMQRIHIAHRRCEQGFQRGAAPLAHNFGTKSSVLHLSRGVHVPEMQKAPYPTP